MMRSLTTRSSAMVRTASRGVALAAAFQLVAPVVSAVADPLQDPYGTFTAQVENDAVSTFKGTSDQYYTSGLRLGWTSGTDNQPPAISNLTRLIWGPGVQRIALGLQQSIFTPRDTQGTYTAAFTSGPGNGRSGGSVGPSDTPPAGDRPYAGVLLGTVNLISDTDLARSIAGIQFGVLGSYAGGYQVQNGFHSLIGDTPNHGWSHQLPNQPILQIQAGRTWRLPLITEYGISADVLPSLSGAAGDFRTYAQLGTTVRIGQGLDSDFGTPRISPGMDGSDAYKATRPVVWYGFAGADGQAVGYDATLEGSTFRSREPHVSKVWDVGEFEAGAAVLYHGVRLSYTQTWQTQEFQGAKSGLFNFGSLALSAKF